MVKVTFSLDDATVATLKRTAARHRKPRSWVVREAISACAITCGAALWTLNRKDFEDIPVCACSDRRAGAAGSGCVMATTPPVARVMTSRLRFAHA